jgi:hypothetical protein
VKNQFLELTSPDAAYSPGEVDELTVSAYHEAGHAAVACYFDIAIGRVWLDPDLKLGGSVEIAKGILIPWRKDVLIALAGSAAERRIDPTRRFARLSTGFPRALKDYVHVDNVLSLGLDDNVSDDALDPIVDRWRRRACALVGRPLVWRGVEALAEALREANWQMTGKAATSVLLRAMRS